MVAKGAPKPVAEKINKWLSEIASIEGTGKFLALAGADPMISTSEQTQEMFMKAIPEWSEYVRIARIPKT